jgi:hypothetical protein
MHKAMLDARAPSAELVHLLLEELHDRCHLLGDLRVPLLDIAHAVRQPAPALE